MQRAGSWMSRSAHVGVPVVTFSNAAMPAMACAGRGARDQVPQSHVEGLRRGKGECATSVGLDEGSNE